MTDDNSWFRPKRYGYGSGLPNRWQGWAVLAVYLAVVGGASFLVQRSPVAFALTLVGATALLLRICAARTRGGWPWRWDENA